MMDITHPLRLLGGLSPQQFMKRHWQKKPLLIRQAVSDFKPLLARGELFEIAGKEGVESRLLSQGERGWKMRQGPLARRSLPPASQPNWTLLVQGMDLHHAGVHDFMQQFRFVPDARLDDLMISYASDMGGVGPHFDSYDVFLFQAAGKRRWRIGRQKDLSLVEGLPLKILANFEPEEEYVLEPGDMLYLPPRWAHDGVALGADCMTYSIGFRQPSRGELARELLTRTADEAADFLGDAPYKDPSQPAVSRPAEVPAAMLEFARDAVERALRDPSQLAMALGEALTEPKTNVWFESSSAPASGQSSGAVILDRRTRMMYDDQHVFINGESYRAGGRDARMMRELANNRTLAKAEVARLSADAIELVNQWKESGWLHLA